MVMDQVQKPGGQISRIASFGLAPDRPELHRV
jgi:alkaline phosphatase D